MYIKHFVKRTTRVKNPLDPGTSVITYQWVSDETTQIADPGLPTGNAYAGDDGWFDLPADIAEKFHHAHFGAGETAWMTLPDAQVEIRAGFMDEAEATFSAVPVPPLPPRPQARLVPPPRKPRTPGKVVAPD